jgi:hypothetical protein
MPTRSTRNEHLLLSQGSPLHANPWIDTGNTRRHSWCWQPPTATDAFRLSLGARRSLLPAREAPGSGVCSCTRCARDSTTRALTHTQPDMCLNQRQITHAPCVLDRPVGLASRGKQPLGAHLQRWGDRGATQRECKGLQHGACIVQRSLSASVFAGVVCLCLFVQGSFVGWSKQKLVGERRGLSRM